jgi:hypothetical protein
MSRRSEGETDFLSLQKEHGNKPQAEERRCRNGRSVRATGLPSGYRQYPGDRGQPTAGVQPADVHRRCRARCLPPRGERGLAFWRVKTRCARSPLFAPVALAVV